MALKSLIKKALKKFFLAIAAPFFLSFIALRLIFRTDKHFSAFSQFLSIAPGKFGVYLRAAFYHLACPNTSDDISIGFLTLLSHRDISISKGVYIGPQCNIGMCSIGKNTLIGSGVHILSGNSQHNFRSSEIPIQQQGGRFVKISIGEDCWIGNQALILSPLASQSVVAAGAVVTKVHNPGDILAGNPSRVIDNRLSKTTPRQQR